MRVLVGTPLGGTTGGIDRLMTSVREELRERPRERVDVRFVSTRGQGSILVAPFVLTLFLCRVLLARPDVVHINVASKGSTYRKLIVAWWARATGARTVIHLHGGGYRRFWAEASPWLDRAICRMFARAARVVVLGHAWHDFVLSKVPDADVVVLPNATPKPTVPHTPSDGAVRLLFLGRLGERKGVYELVEALASLSGSAPWRLVFAGNGEVDEVRRQVAEHGLGDRVKVPGWVGPTRVAELLAASDVLVLPSHDENLPIAVIEAMAAGIAVIATPVGAVEDIVVDGETGLLVPPGDVAALTAALQRLIEDPALRARLGTAGQAVHRARLDIGPYVDSLVEIWRAAARA